MDLTLSTTDHDGIAVLSVAGEIDLATVPKLRDQLIELTADHPGQAVVVDLGGVSFLDSTGLGVLVGGQRRARGHDGELHLVVSSSRLVDIFVLTRLDAVFAIHGTLSE